MNMTFPAQRGNFPPQFNSSTPTGKFRQGSQGNQVSGHSGRGHKNDRVLAMLPNDLKIPKPPKQPDKPLPAYMRYSRKVWEKVKSQHPEMKMWDIGKLIGEQWRNLPEDERQGFFAEYEVEKLEYQEAMKAYHNSTAYRDWLKAKERATNALQEQQMMEKMMGGNMPKEEPRFQLQQIEDDDEEDFTTKHIAAARFQRNHRLVADIFSEATVPDIKTIVTRPRLENLKRQVQSLMQHQRKLESEIEEMEAKFSLKKQKIMEQTNTFVDQMKHFDEKSAQAAIDLPSPMDENDSMDEDQIKNEDSQNNDEVLTEKKTESTVEPLTKNSLDSPVVTSTVTPAADPDVKDTVPATSVSLPVQTTFIPTVGSSESSSQQSQVTTPIQPFQANENKGQ